MGGKGSPSARFVGKGKLLNISFSHVPLLGLPGELWGACLAPSYALTICVRHMCGVMYFSLVEISLIQSALQLSAGLFGHVAIELRLNLNSSKPLLNVFFLLVLYYAIGKVC